MRVPVLLLWDDFSGHWTGEVVAYVKTLNVVLLKVPKSATAVSQPADVAWNFPFKERLRGCWVELLREQLRAHTGGTKFIVTAPDRIKVATWIRLAWDGLTRSTIASGYSKAFGTLLDDADVAAADLIDTLVKHCAIDADVGEVDSDDDIGDE